MSVSVYVSEGMTVSTNECVQKRTGEEFTQPVPP